MEAFAGTCSCFGQTSGAVPMSTRVAFVVTIVVGGANVGTDWWEYVRWSGMGTFGHKTVIHFPSFFLAVAIIATVMWVFDLAVAWREIQGPGCQNGWKTCLALLSIASQDAPMLVVYVFYLVTFRVCGLDLFEEFTSVPTLLSVITILLHLLWELGYYTIWIYCCGKKNKGVKRCTCSCQCFRCCLGNCCVWMVGVIVLLFGGLVLFGMRLVASNGDSRIFTRTIEIDQFGKFRLPADARADEAMFLDVEFRLQQNYVMRIQRVGEQTVSESFGTIHNRIYVGIFRDLAKVKEERLVRFVPCTRAFPFTAHPPDCHIIFSFT